MAADRPRPALHLPDLPEVTVQLGHQPLAPDQQPGAAARATLPWSYLLRQGLSSYLPLLLMALLAISTWWLVRHTPQAPGSRAEGPQRLDPDYTMDSFAITRFGPDGRVVLRIAGDTLRHYPATDRLEIEGVPSTPSRPTAAPPTPPHAGPWPMATAARCSCSAARK